MPKRESKTIVFFDGSCPLCRAEIGAYRNADTSRALCLFDVSKPQTTFPSSLDREKAMTRFHVMSSGGQLLSGAAAFVEIWRLLPRWRWASKAASLPGVTSTLEAAYRLFLPLRPLLSHLFVLLQRDGRRLRRPSLR